MLLGLYSATRALCKIKVNISSRIKIVLPSSERLVRLKLKTMRIKRGSPENNTLTNFNIINKVTVVA